MRPVWIILAVAVALTAIVSAPSWSFLFQRSDDFPTYGPGSGVIQIDEGQTVNFYAEGKVALQNRIGFCLNVSPEGAFNLTWSDNGRLYWVEAKSGKRELATVTSLAATNC